MAKRSKSQVPPRLAQFLKDRRSFTPSPDYPEANANFDGLYAAVQDVLAKAGVGGLRPPVADALTRGPTPRPILKALAVVYPTVDFDSFLEPETVEIIDSARRLSEGIVRLKAARATLKQRRSELSQIACSYYLGHADPRSLAKVDFDFPLLQRNEWKLASPLPLHQLECHFEHTPDRSPARIFPGMDVSYSSVLASLSQDSMLWNGHAYRLTGVHPAGKIGQPPRLTFGPGDYFGYLNTCEVLGMELAEKAVSGPALRVPQRLPWRGRLEDAFDFSNRCAVAGLNCLMAFTDYKPNPGGPAKSVFLMHDRKGGPTVEAGDVRHVVPAGTFQSIADGDEEHDRDFSISRTLARELFEEVFGMTEVEQQRGDLVDPMAEEPYASALKVFRDKRHTRIYFLGLGLDPVTTKPELLFVAISSWRRLVEANGLKLSPNGEGKVKMLALSKERLAQEAATSDMLAAGAACMSLAAEHYDALFARGLFAALIG
ncbi:MAG: hypothetical protein ACM3YN_04705 [Parcubacteria group bacterium]